MKTLRNKAEEGKATFARTCTMCNAQPGEPCRKPNGKIRPPHKGARAPYGKGQRGIPQVQQPSLVLLRPTQPMSVQFRERFGDALLSDPAVARRARYHYFLWRKTNNDEERLLHQIYRAELIARGYESKYGELGWCPADML